MTSVDQVDHFSLFFFQGDSDSTDEMGIFKAVLKISFHCDLQLSLVVLAIRLAPSYN